jgi:hypothetical protein
MATLPDPLMTHHQGGSEARGADRGDHRAGAREAPVVRMVGVAKAWPVRCENETSAEQPGSVQCDGAKGRAQERLRGPRVSGQLVPASGLTLALREQVFDGRHQHGHALWLLHVHAFAISVAQLVVAAVGDEWDVAFLHAGANHGAITVTQRMIQDGGG